jgi:tetratricopeptide (TPR) repeat protein
MMTRTPWKLWDVETAAPAEGADTLECLEVLDRAIAEVNEQGISWHPAILHLHLHVLEMSFQPERALKSADILGTLCPDAGHMNHMPGHIYVLCGQYEDAKSCSIRAIDADRLYLLYAGPFNFYTTARCHDLHMMMHACMFLGQFDPAYEAAREMCENVTPEILGIENRPQMCITLEGYCSTAIHVLVRFGKWQRIIDTPLPEPPDLYCVSTSMHHYARTVAYAYMNRFEEAGREREQFLESLGRIPAGRKFFNNLALDVLAVAQSMMDGELEYHRGNHEVAFEHLRESVRRDDKLAYSEPGAWMHPPRHALGALLLEQGLYDEAERVYRTDLGMNENLHRCARHPGNIWSLHGLAECLGRKPPTKELELVSRELERVAARADQEITSSCCCRKSVSQSCNSTGADRLHLNA